MIIINWKPAHLFGTIGIFDEFLQTFDGKIALADIKITTMLLQRFVR